MKAKEKAIALCIALASLFTLANPFGLALAEAAEPSEILAEKVPFSQLAPGDSFVIVSENANAAFSLNTQWDKLSLADITLVRIRAAGGRRHLPEMPKWLSDNLGRGRQTVLCPRFRPERPMARHRRQLDLQPRRRHVLQGGALFQYLY